MSPGMERSWVPINLLCSQLSLAPIKCEEPRGG